MYNVGDFVVYRQLTVCKIQAIQTPSFERDTKKQYYQLLSIFDSSGTTVYVPIKAVDSLRPVLSAEEAEKALQTLPSLKPTICALKKPPQLTAYYQSILATCDINKYLCLIKEVALKSKDGKKLSEIDMRYRNKVEQLLCEEFSISLQTTPEEIKKRINENLL